jgi:hypothetical protein
MSDSDLEPDLAMDAEQEAEVRLLSNADLRLIDDCILSHMSHHFQKTARIVGQAMLQMADRFPGIPDVFYSARIKLLAQSGMIEAAGNLDRMRHSEVRLARNK